MEKDTELDDDLEEIGYLIERLRIHYRNFFHGLEKRPPIFNREQLDRKIRYSKLNDAKKAVFKFRFISLMQRYRTMAAYWDRTLRELEEGNFSREDLRRKAGFLPLKAKPESKKEKAQDVATPVAESTEIETQKPSGDINAPDQVALLYADYLSARSSLGMSNDKVSEEAFRASLEKQRLIQAEYLGVPDVKFSVTVREGRVKLLAKPVRNQQ